MLSPLSLSLTWKWMLWLSMICPVYTLSSPIKPCVPLNDRYSAADDTALIERRFTRQIRDPTVESFRHFWQKCFRSGSSTHWGPDIDRGQRSLFNVRNYFTTLHCYHIGWLDHQSPESRIALRAMYSCMRQLLDGSDAEENGLLWFGCWFPMGQVPKIGGFNITQMEFPEHLYRSRGVEISWDVWSDSDKNFISLASLVFIVFLGCLTTVRCDLSICYGFYLYV